MVHHYCSQLLTVKLYFYWKLFCDLAKLKSSSVIKLIQSLTNLFKLIFEYTCTQFIKLLFSLWNQTTLPSLIDTKDIKYLMMSHFVLPMSESSVPQTGLHIDLLFVFIRLMMRVYRKWFIWLICWSAASSLHSGYDLLFWCMWFVVLFFCVKGYIKSCFSHFSGTISTE